MRSPHSLRRVGVVAAGALLVPAFVLGATSPAPATTTTAAAALDKSLYDALDQTGGGISGAELKGDAQAVGLISKPFYGFPSQGGSAMVLSTGKAAVVADPDSSKKSTKTQNGDDAGTILGNKLGADGNDLTQVDLKLTPPSGSGCVSFDFMFLSEEYPRYLKQKYNDVFTAELGKTDLTLKGADVVAPNNFAFSSDKEVLSVNAFSRFVDAPKSSLNGRSDKYSATAPLPDGGKATDLYLTVQDLGDSYLDSAVVVDNLRYVPGGSKDCAAGVESKKDSDGDGLSDVWETKGIDLDKDGKPELDLPAMGADPQHKDVFVEADWMVKDPNCTKANTTPVCSSTAKFDFTPRPKAIKDVVDAFAAAPVDNPDSKRGITLHVDAGPDSLNADGKKWGAAGEGAVIPYEKNIGTSMGTALQRAAELRQKNSPDVRQSVFHYVIFGEQYANGDSSGVASLPGKNLLVTSNDWNWPIGEEAGTFMHELGHNLGIRHGGSDEENYKEGYYSLLNYDFQFVGVDENGKLDYSRGDVDYKLKLRENKKENAHVGRNGQVPSLNTYDDWANIKYTGNGDLGALGVSGAKDADAEGPKETLDFDAVTFDDGTATIALVGPTLVAKGLDQQVEIADVTNVSTIDGEYDVQITSSAMSGTASVEVPAGKTVRVEVPIKVTAAPADPVAVTAALSYKGKLMTTSTLDVNAVDLSDDSTQSDVKETLEEVKTDPPAGLEQDVVTSLNKTVAPKVGVDLSKTKVKEPKEASSLPLPIWAIGLIVVGVLAVGGIAVTSMRKKA